MDKKKIGFFIVGIGMVLLIAGLIFNVIDSQKKENTPVSNTKPTNEKTVEEDIHEHTEYIQDGDQDPFKSNKLDYGQVEVNDLTFDFEFLNNATYKNTAATLIDASPNYLLFNNYTNVLSFYIKQDAEKKVIADHINLAMITPDEKYIIYTKNALTEEQFYFLDLTTLQNEQFGTYTGDSRIKAIDMKYKDGLVYYLLKDTKTNKTSVHYISIPAYQENHTARERNSVLPVNAEHLYYFDDDVYVFNKDTNAVEKVTPNNPTEPLVEIKSEKVDRISSIDFYDKDTWAITLFNKDNESVILLPNKKIKSFKGLISAKWFDKSHLIVNDNLTLYSYNLDTNKKAVIKSDISYLFTSPSSLYIQTNDGEILTLKKK